MRSPCSRGDRANRYAVPLLKALSTFMGHANIRITLDQYGHLLPGAEDEAAGLLDAFLVRQVGGADGPDCRGNCRATRRSALHRGTTWMYYI